MLRRIRRFLHVLLIVGLTVGAAGSGTLWVFGVVSPTTRTADTLPRYAASFFGYGSLLQRLHLAEGKLWVRYNFLVDPKTIFFGPTRRSPRQYGPIARTVVNIGPFKVEIVKPERRRILRQWVDDTPPAGLTGLHKMVDKNLVRIQISHLRLWVPFTLLVAYPTIALIRGPLRRRRRRKRGLCIECGYNLKGNVSDVCPECGIACSASD